MSNVEKAVEALKAVYATHAAGCCLHILADDGNIEQAHASWCAGYATAKGHEACMKAADILDNMTDAERQRVYERYDEYAGGLTTRFPFLRKDK